MPTQYFFPCENDEPKSVTFFLVQIKLDKNLVVILLVYVLIPKKKVTKTTIINVNIEMFLKLNGISKKCINDLQKKEFVN